MHERTRIPNNPDHIDHDIIHEVGFHFKFHECLYVKEGRHENVNKRVIHVLFHHFVVAEFCNLYY